MSVRIRTRPGLTISYGNTMLMSDTTGEMARSRKEGLFASDTRFISEYRLTINGHAWPSRRCRKARLAPRSPATHSLR